MSVVGREKNERRLERDGWWGGEGVGGGGSPARSSDCTHTSTHTLINSGESAAAHRAAISAIDKYLASSTAIPQCEVFGTLLFLFQSA